MPTPILIAAGASSVFALPAGHTMSIVGNGSAQVAPPVPAFGDGAMRFLSNGSATIIGPYAIAVNVNLVALSGGSGISGSDLDGSGVASRSALITLAEANGLTPGTTYKLDDGLTAYALTSRFLQPLGPWFVDGRRWSVGSNTSASDLTYTYLPPLAPNAAVDIWSQWSVDAVAVTKRARLYLAGTLGGGVSGATAVYTRNINGAADKGLNLYTRIQCRNDAASQKCLTIGDSAAFALTTSDWLDTAVSMNTSQLLRAMGETSKTGTDVVFSGTRVGTLATATKVAHGLTTGDYIGVTGATPSQYNVDPAAITVLTADTFTYVMASDPGASTGGSPVYQKYCKNELVAFRVNIHQGLGF